MAGVAAMAVAAMVSAGGATASPLSGLSRLAPDVRIEDPAPVSGDDAMIDHLSDLHDRYVVILGGYVDLKNAMAAASATAMPPVTLVSTMAKLILKHMETQREAMKAFDEDSADDDASDVAETLEISAGSSWEGSAGELTVLVSLLKTVTEGSTEDLTIILRSAAGTETNARGVVAISSFMETMQAYDEAVGADASDD